MGVWERNLKLCRISRTSASTRSALCICSRKWKANLLVPVCFGTKTSKFCFKIIFLFVTGVRVKFRVGRLRNKLRSSTLAYCQNCELTAWNFESNSQYSRQRQFYLRMSCFSRNGNLADAKWSSRKTKSRKENPRTALSQLDGNFVT